MSGESESVAAETTHSILQEEPFLRALARRMHRCDAEVDDLVQETLMRAYRARARYMPGTCLRAWLATILRRKHLTDRLTHRRRRTETFSDTALVMDRVGARSLLVDASVGDLYARAVEQLDDPLRRALDALPDIFRDPFILHALGGLTYQEIAEHAGVPLGTVMSRIHRTRLRLRFVVYSLDRGSRAIRARGRMGSKPRKETARALHEDDGPPCEERRLPGKRPEGEAAGGAAA